MNYFDLKLKETPRTMTREAWYSTQRWLRTIRRQTHEEFDIGRMFSDSMRDLMCYGGCQINPMEYKK